MSTSRFTGYIHSIVGHQVMVSPSGKSGDQFKCALDDFESIMPSGQAEQPFTFHVKRDRIGVEHYRHWLGLAKTEIDRLGNIEQAIMNLTQWVAPPATAVPAEQESAEAFATRWMEDKAG